MMWTGGVMNSITVITDGIACIAGMRAGKFLHEKSEPCNCLLLLPVSSWNGTANRAITPLRIPGIVPLPGYSGLT
jgi:hypothetical protein